MDPGPRKDRPVLSTVLHHRERRRWEVVTGEARGEARASCVCVRGLAVGLGKDEKAYKD